MALCRLGLDFLVSSFIFTMSEHTREEIQHHVKIYIRVFSALAALTVVTVGISYLHLPLVLAIIVALCIASFKAGLVATFFMHLAYEKKIIFWILFAAFFFFIFVLILPSISHF